MNKSTTAQVPEMAIVENNTLAAIGLRQILEEAMPFMRISTFGSFAEFEASDPDRFMHCFVSMHIVLANRPFFMAGNRQRRTMVLTLGSDPSLRLQGFHCISVNVPESCLVKELLSLQHRGHPHGEHLPRMQETAQERTLSDRETEVLALVAQGKMNKEIADQLCIGLTTVITHRKNIQEKLGLRTVSALTIYAVMHGYVDINSI